MRCGYPAAERKFNKGKDLMGTSTLLNVNVLSVMVGSAPAYVATDRPAGSGFRTEDGAVRKAEQYCAGTSEKGSRCTGRQPCMLRCLATHARGRLQL